MATGIGLVSVTQIQNLSKSQHQHQNQPNPNSSTTTNTPPPPAMAKSTSTWMWTPTDQQQDQEDDSWEVRAFAEDTSNIMGTTWPPRSYTCTFCRREFRSAQALGGHMNVHRRDRARLHQASPNNANPISSLSLPHPAPSFLSHSQDFVSNAGLCLLYPFPSPNSVPFSSLSHHTACGDSFSSYSHPPNNFIRMPTCSDYSLPHPAAGTNAFSSYSAKVEEQQPATSSASHARHDDLDLELRLGNRST